MKHKKILTFVRNEANLVFKFRGSCRTEINNGYHIEMNNINYEYMNDAYMLVNETLTNSKI